MKRGFTKEIKIGIITIVSLTLLYIGVNYLKGVNLFQPVNRYFIQFDNVEDVTVSSPVFVDGFKVGLVRSISYDYNNNSKIKVEVSLDDNMKVNKNSYAVIMRSFLGGAKLHLHLNKYTDDYLKPGDVLEGRMTEDMIESVSSNVLPMLENMLPKIDTILVGLQALITNPALAQTLKNLENTTANLEASSKQLNRILDKDMPVIISDFKTVSGNFNQFSENLKSLEFQTTVNNINATLANIKQTTDLLNSRENSLGMLLNDKSLYNNMNGAMDNASKLLIDLKENPKRYVHFSLF